MSNSTMKRHRPVTLCLLLLLFVSLRVQAAGLDEKAIDHVATRALDAFEVPGMAIAVVSNGETIFLKGYGLRDVERDLPINPRTYFRIGSTSKAFTSAALALLVQEDKLGWDDKVTDHLPGFSLYDARGDTGFLGARLAHPSLRSLERSGRLHVVACALGLQPGRGDRQPSSLQTGNAIRLKLRL